jgi:hypothetical protein
MQTTKKATKIQINNIIKMLTHICVTYTNAHKNATQTQTQYAQCVHAQQQLQDTLFILTAINTFAVNNSCLQLYNTLLQQDTIIVQQYNKVVNYLTTNNLI